MYSNNYRMSYLDEKLKAEKYIMLNFSPALYWLPIYPLSNSYYYYFFYYKKNTDFVFL